MSSVEVDLLGGCLCGGVRYRVQGLPNNPCFCHCNTCRKAHGVSPVAWFTISVTGLTVLNTASLKERASSAEAVRSFCSECGANLFFKRLALDEIDIATGTLDDANSDNLPVSVIPVENIHTESRCNKLMPNILAEVV